MTREQKLWIALGLTWLGLLAVVYMLMRRPVADQEQAIIRTNQIIRERLVVLTNTITNLEAQDRREREAIRAAAAISNALSLDSAIQRFYAFQSNR